MNFELTPELLERQVTRRFNKLSNQLDEGLSKLAINEDLFLDLLCIFKEPDSFRASDFFNYPLPAIIGYLKKTHELYKVKSLQEILMVIERLDRSNNELGKLRTSLFSFFATFKNDLEKHIDEEEVKLFPYIQKLFEYQHNQHLGIPIQEPILADFFHNHNDCLERDLYNLVQALEALSESHTDSFAFRMLVNRLTVFELDLRIHGKIEEEVLLVKASDLEEKIFGKTTF
jgi:regulator of cell morphogenesis and NO signaling